jgi:hypothetical protein
MASATVRQKRYAAIQNTWIESTMPLLEGQDQVYGDPGQVATLQERWTVPKAYPRAISLRQHEVGLVNTTLSGQDQFYGAPGQAINLEQAWIVPKGYRRIESALAWADETVNTPQEIEPEAPPESRGFHDRPYLFNTGRSVIADFTVPLVIGADDFPPGKIDIAEPYIQIGAGGVPYIIAFQGAEIVDTIYGAPGQVPNFEERWIVPKGYRRTEPAYSWAVDLLNTPGVLDVFFGDPGQPPNFQERWIVTPPYRRIESSLALLVNLIQTPLDAGAVVVVTDDEGAWYVVAKSARMV